MSLFILIPCKGLERGKSRLSDVLDPASRRALCESFLRRTLAVAISFVPANQVCIITSDDEVAAIASGHAARIIKDDERGLNQALDLARNTLVSVTNAAHSTLILPADLPLATPAALSEMTTATEDVVIVPDEEDDGTNLLLLGPRALGAFSFAYGQGSFEKHWMQARRHRLRFRILRHPALCFDVDRSDQYARWVGVEDIRLSSLKKWPNRPALVCSPGAGIPGRPR